MTPVVLMQGARTLRVHYFDTEAQARDFARSWMVGGRMAFKAGYSQREPIAALPTLREAFTLDDSGWAGLTQRHHDAIALALQGD